MARTHTNDASNGLCTFTLECGPSGWTLLAGREKRGENKTRTALNARMGFMVINLCAPGLLFRFRHISPGAAAAAVSIN